MANRGMNSSQGASDNFQPPTATQVLRDSYHARLEEHIGKAADSFKQILQSCLISDKATNARADFQSEVEAANLARAADELLRLISELKIAVITHMDGKECKVENLEMKAYYDGLTKLSLNEVKTMKESVADCLSGLERHYYDSCTRWGGGEAPSAEGGDIPPPV